MSVENQAAISTVLRKARQKGISVVTWDADAEKDARDFLINQATPEGIGYTLTDEAARILNGKGEFAIITASLSAANQNEWIKHIKARLADKYPDLKLVAIQPSDGDRDRAFAETQTVLKVYPQVKLVMAIAAPAVPWRGGGSRAIRPKRRQGNRSISAEYVQALCALWCGREHRALEYARPRLSDCLCVPRVESGRAKTRRQRVNRRPAGQS